MITSISMIDDFICAFNKHADLYVIDEFHRDTKPFVVAEKNDLGFKKWRPLRFYTPPEKLDEIYQTTKGRFPKLFEELLLSYRWLEVDLTYITLLPNLVSEDLKGFLYEIKKDKFMSKVLLENNFIQFAKGPGGNYDPICFEVDNKKEINDYRIVQIDHEELLCKERIKIVKEISKSMHELMKKIIKNDIKDV